MGVDSDAYISADVPQDKAEVAIWTLYTMENISEIVRVTGERRIMFRIRASDNSELCEMLDKKIRPLGSRTSMSRWSLKKPWYHTQAFDRTSV